MRNEEVHGPYLGGYKHYCLLDFYEIERLQKLLDNKSPIDKIDMNTIFSCIKGQSIFTYFEGNIRLLKTISAQLSEYIVQETRDYDEEMLTDPKILKLILILIQTSQIKHDEKGKVKTFSILQRSMLDKENIKARDALFDVANNCQAFSLFDIMTDNKYIENVLKKASPQIANFFNQSFFETKTTRQIESLKLPAYRTTK